MNRPLLFLIISFSGLLISGCSTSEKKENSMEAVPTGAPDNNDNNMDTVEEKIIIDSDMTFEEAIAGTNAPSEIINQLTLLNVEYYSFDDQLHRGQVVVNKAIEKDIQEIFELIKEIRFPVQQAIPISVFNWDDDLSMENNNTSSFCYRKVAGTNNLSKHATGMAIDINPYQNPLIWKAPYENRPASPQGAYYKKDHPGTFHAQHPVVSAFKKRKFIWGASFSKYYDYHHFHRNL